MIKSVIYVFPSRLKTEGWLFRTVQVSALLEIQDDDNLYSTLEIHMIFVFSWSFFKGTEGLKDLVFSTFSVKWLNVCCCFTFCNYTCIYFPIYNVLVFHSRCWNFFFFFWLCRSIQQCPLPQKCWRDVVSMIPDECLVSQHWMLSGPTRSFQRQRYILFSRLCMILCCFSRPRWCVERSAFF